MTITTALGFDEWSPNQDSPEVPVNEAIAGALGYAIAVKAKGTSAPPGSPTEGERHIVGASPSGAWASFTEDNIAKYHNGAWIEIPALDRMTVFVEGGATSITLWRYDATGGAWAEILLGAHADVIKRNVTATLTVGYSHTPGDLGTQSSGTLTPDEANGAMQKVTNGGAFTLVPPGNNTSLLLKVTNNASAGAITTTGFTKVTGDALTTTDGDKFILNIDRIDGESLLHVRALQ